MDLHKPDCFVCGKSLSTRYQRDNEETMPFISYDGPEGALSYGVVSDGATCESTGNYGSRCIDEEDCAVYFVICDDCFKERADRVAIRGYNGVVYPDKGPEFLDCKWRPPESEKARQRRERQMEWLREFRKRNTGESNEGT